MPQHPEYFFALQKYGFYFNLTKKTGTFLWRKLAKYRHIAEIMN